MPTREIASIYNVPKPRQEWVDGRFVQYSEEDEAWVELFIDLVYVVLLSKLGIIGEVCIEQDWFYLFKLIVIFTVMCLTRQAIDEYANRFYSHDMTHKVVYLVYTLGVFIQVLNINAHLTDDYHCSYHENFGFGLSVGVLVTRISLILIYLFVVYHNDRAQHQFIFDLCRFFISVIILVISITINRLGMGNDKLETILLAVLGGQEILIWIISRVFFRARFSYPIDLDKMQSRWGTWVMIVIGEAIIQMLYQTTSVTALSSHYDFYIMSVILMFSLSMQYYDACQCEWYNHALTKSAVAGISWIWLHVPMSLFLFGVGANLKVLLESLDHHEFVPQFYVSIFCVSLGMTSLLMTVIRLTNNTLNCCMLHFADACIYSLRVVVSGVQVSVVAWFPEISSVKLIGIHMAISVFMNIVDLLYDFYVNPNTQWSRQYQETANGMGVTISMASPASNIHHGERRPSRPWTKLHLAKNRTDIETASAKRTLMKSKHHEGEHLLSSPRVHPVTHGHDQEKQASHRHHHHHHHAIADEQSTGTVGEVGHGHGHGHHHHHHVHPIVDQGNEGHRPHSTSHLVLNDQNPHSHHHGHQHHLEGHIHGHGYHEDHHAQPHGPGHHLGDHHQHPPSHPVSRGDSHHAQFHNDTNATNFHLPHSFAEFAHDALHVLSATAAAVTHTVEHVATTSNPNSARRNSSGESGIVSEKPVNDPNSIDQPNAPINPDSIVDEWSGASEHEEKLVETKLVFDGFMFRFVDVEVSDGSGSEDYDGSDKTSARYNGSLTNRSTRSTRSVTERPTARDGNSSSKGSSKNIGDGSSSKGAVVGSSKGTPEDGNITNKRSGRSSKDMRSVSLTGVPRLAAANVQPSPRYVQPGSRLVRFEVPAVNGSSSKGNGDLSARSSKGKSGKEIFNSLRAAFSSRNESLRQQDEDVGATSPSMKVVDIEEVI